MKDTILEQLGAILMALNNITVSGKNNLANLSGSIQCLEDVASKLSAASFAEEGGEEK